MDVEVAGALVELAAAVVEMHPLAGLDRAHGDADDDSKFDDGCAFGDGREGNLVAELDLLPCGEVGVWRGADDLERRACRGFAEQRGDVVGGVHLESGWGGLHNPILWRRRRRRWLRG